MEELLARQAAGLEEIKGIRASFKQDSAAVKTAEYIREKVRGLDAVWERCLEIDAELMKAEDKTGQYFTENIFRVIKGWYEGTRREIEMCETKPIFVFDSAEFVGGSQGEFKITELLQLQNANFRAFERLVNNICLDEISEKWHIDDKLKNLESRWSAIEKLHLRIDSIMGGTTGEYNTNFMKHESKFEELKRELNKKLSSTVHQQQSMPKIDIPTFSGSYAQWPTFMDLFVEAIHNNPAVPKAQKMQHLKGRLRGEAEKLVQHLHIAPENYDTCWDLLKHRYNNKYLLFTKNFQTFMRQPSIQKQTAFELKRLYDISNETLNAIHNLGVDTSTWDPMLVYVLSEKLDSDTYSEYMQSRLDPREIPTFDSFMDFIENKFMALEPLQKNKPDKNVKLETKPQFNNASYPFSKNSKSAYYQSPNKSSSYNSRKFHAYNVGKFSKITCPLCNSNHALYHCAKFSDLSGAEKLNTVAKYKLCKNCLFEHTKGYCGSQKRCKECNEPHNTLLHDATAKSEQRSVATPQAGAKSNAQSTSNKSASHKNMQNNFASNNDDEILLATALVQVATADGNYITLRALVDQGSQITLITENAAQRLGLHRQQLNASISGIGTLSNRSKGKVDLCCKSLLDDFQFTTEALIMTRVVNNLPNATFTKKPWAHVTNITLADPDYNISRPIDILLDAHVYSEILMNGLIKGEGSQPIAQQTRLGWILSGNVKTYNCSVVINNVDDFSKYWEIEDIQGDAQNNMTSEEAFCEDFFALTTKRLENGRYEVRLPMKPNYEQLLGKSKPRALGQFMQLERKLGNDEKLSDSYIIVEKVELRLLGDGANIEAGAVLLMTLAEKHTGM